jgi:hypothetical protein
MWYASVVLPSRDPKEIVRPLLLLLLAGLFGAGENAAAQSLNALALSPASPGSRYEFLTCGHIYGEPSGGRSLYPAASFLAAMEQFEALQPSFLVLLGDVIEETNEEQLAIFERTVTRRLQMPVFNAVGNHDVLDRGLYEEHFGKTFYAFDHGRERYVFLDSELLPGRIRGAQRSFLFQQLSEASTRREINSVFIFSHKLLWAERGGRFSTVGEHVNSVFEYASDDEFVTEIEPALREAARTTSVYWISGDIGRVTSLPLFYHRDELSDITYLAVGIGDTQDDSVLRVTIEEEGTVHLSAVSLRDGSVVRVEDYGLEFWEDHFQEEGHALWKKTGRVLRQKSLWLGFLAGVVTCGGCLVLLRKVPGRGRSGS